MTIRRAVHHTNPALAYQPQKSIDPWSLLIRSPGDAARVVAANPVYVHCGLCGASQTEAEEIKQPHRCVVANRIRAERLRLEAMGLAETPHIGPRHGEPIRCSDCEGLAYAGIVHDCPGPKKVTDSNTVEALNEQNRHRALLGDLKDLGLLDKLGNHQ